MSTPPPFRRLRAWAGAALLLGGLSACAAAPESAATAAPANAASASSPVGPALPLRLIAFNDFHGHLEAAGQSLPWPDPAQAGRPVSVPVGGAAALGGLVQRLRAAAPDSLLISSGDLVGAAPLVSTLFRHESTVAVANRLGVDVGAVGNHEFDAGLTELQRLMHGGCRADAADEAVRSCADGQPFTGMRFPLLGANVVDATSGRPVLAPSAIFQIHGVPVGVIGAVTRSTPGIVVPSGIRGLRFTDEAEAINTAARALQAQGVHTLVAVVHEGGELGSPGQRADWNDASCPGAHGPIFDIAQRLLPQIQVVFSAHTHQGYRCVRDGRVIIQATSYGRGVSVVDLMLDAKTGAPLPAQTRSINLPVLNRLTPAALRTRIVQATPAPWGEALALAGDDPTLAAMVARDVAAVRPVAERPVGRLLGHFTRGGPHGESTVGHLVADAQWAATRAPAQGGAELALTNPGGLRGDLLCDGQQPPCAVGYGALFTVQPFGNDVMVLTLTGAQLRALLEQQARPDGTAKLLQPSASLRYTWTASAPAGQHVSDLTVGGQPVQPGRDYRVAVNSFLAEGGDGFTLLRQGRDRHTGPNDADALVAFVQQAAPAPDPAPRVTWRP
ncbi:bifunctional metallophosphatase/5'-nucleotidase [Ideonella dechloratans]|uniref:bifunctional metallophosphatase/5'-nucleotidase n=1 Tax=Ideonella dechloratans TaxID=36863 RepID=UPI0035B1022E